jgi:hypothetical protein
MADNMTTKLFSELVREIDPSEEEKPAYEFSNGRKFVQPAELYRPEQG